MVLLKNLSISSGLILRGTWRRGVDSSGRSGNPPGKVKERTYFPHAGGFRRIAPCWGYLHDPSERCTKPAITCFTSDDAQYLEFVEDMSTIQPQKKASRKVHLARHSDCWVSFHAAGDMVRNRANTGRLAHGLASSGSADCMRPMPMDAWNVCACASRLTGDATRPCRGYSQISRMHVGRSDHVVTGKTSPPSSAKLLSSRHHQKCPRA